MNDTPDDRTAVCHSTTLRSRYGSPELRREQTRHLLQSLEKLYCATDPAKGEQSASGKDLAAQMALYLSGKLVEHVAGWAVDHVIGKAALGLDFVGSQPNGVVHRPDYLASLEQADKHDHEQAGSEMSEHLEISDCDPTAARIALRNLLRANSGGYPYRISTMAEEALRALAFGEVLPILQPERSKPRKARYLELRAQLRAMEHVAYRVAMNIKKFHALQQVAEAYGVEIETIRTWEKRAKVELGHLEVASKLADAKHSARQDISPMFSEVGERTFGRLALQRDGDRYKEILKQKQ